MGNKGSVELTEQLQLRLKNILIEYFGREVVFDKVYEFPEVEFSSLFSRRVYLHWM